jgi:hypothetical protein
MKDETKRSLSGALVLGVAFLLGCGRGNDTARDKGRENPAVPNPVAEYARTISVEEPRSESIADTNMKSTMWGDDNVT